MEQLVKFDPGLIFWTWTTFFIVLGILGWKAWRPMLLALEGREARIREALVSAEKARIEAGQLTARYEEQLQVSRQEAQQVIADARMSAEKLRVELEESARKKAYNLLSKAQEQIAADREKALREIRINVVNLSLDVASKVIERNLTTDDNRKLADESLRG
ncbi:MAG: F0F1 ATP synthase subunit B, partial [Candidatus Marinimicrobia bacterium]|nr:F0F1 ATP synthase subunit B [Candidatus Neomarinimicrobiota bacterium]